MKLLLIDNIGSHYRFAIFHLLDLELGCDFCFGDKVDDIKKLDYSLLEHKVTEVHNKPLKGGLYWQEGVGRLLREDYDTYLIAGETRCLSTWWLCVKQRLFYPRKRVYYWTHGWYGKETRMERFIKKIFLRLPSGGVFTYGDYARNLMIKEGFNPEKLHTIYNSLDYDAQLLLRQSLTPSNLYREHFGNDNPVIVFIGRLTPVKKLDMVLRAADQSRQNGEKYNVTFVGDGSQRAALEGLTEELGLTDSVWFYGACYDEKTNAELIYNADLCVSPGNIGLTAMHALMFGCPAITNDDFSHQMPEFEAIQEGRTGTFFHAGDVCSLAENLFKWFARHHDEREQVRKACYEEIDGKWNPHVQMEIFKDVLFKTKDK